MCVLLPFVLSFHPIPYIQSHLTKHSLASPLQFIIPETKQIPLERMDELFAPGVKPWRAHRLVMAGVHESRARRDVLAAKAGSGSPHRSDSATSFEKGRDDQVERV